MTPDIGGNQEQEIIHDKREIDGDPYRFGTFRVSRRVSEYSAGGRSFAPLAEIAYRSKGSRPLASREHCVRQAGWQTPCLRLPYGKTTF